MAIKYLQIPCQKIISGGQTGVDRGALDACLDTGFPCGGWIPLGRRAEDSTVSASYPLNETHEADYEVRTSMNVRDADGTLILAHGDLSGGTEYTVKCAKKLRRPLLILYPDDVTQSDLSIQIQDWIQFNHITVLNVAGPRQSEWKEGYSHAYHAILQLINKIHSLPQGT